MSEILNWIAFLFFAVSGIQYIIRANILDKEMRVETKRLRGLNDKLKLSVWQANQLLKSKSADCSKLKE